MCWRNDLQHPLVVLVMGKLPCEACGCPDGPSKESTPCHAGALLPTQDFRAVPGKAEAGEQLGGELRAGSDSLELRAGQ